MNKRSISDLDFHLWSAIGSDNTQDVQRLICQGANSNWPGKRGRTAVHQACLLNCPRQLNILIAAGGLPEAIDDDRETPLHLAALNGHLSIVERLIDLGVNLETRGDYGSPLDRAACGGHVDVIAALLNGGALLGNKSPRGRTALHEAARYGHTEVARLLLRRGAEVDSADQIGNNRTPLHEAIYPGSAPLVELLILYGANIEHRNNWGATPLHMAARIGAADVVELLLRVGADRNAIDREGNIPLDEAIEKHHLKIAFLLKEQPTRKNCGNETQIVMSQQDSVLKKINSDIGLSYQPDGEERVHRNEEAMRVLGGKTWGYESAKEIASEVKVVPLNHLLKLKQIKRQQDLAKEIQWLSPVNAPLLIIFVSHRWEHASNPDPYRTQLGILKAITKMFIEIAIGLKECRNKRLKRLPTLRIHGLLQASYFVGEIASFVDGFQGTESALQQELLNRVGIFYDFMSIPQKPHTIEEQKEYQQSLLNFRRLMASTPVLTLRYPDDEYSLRSWCEVEFWSAGRLSKNSFSTTPVVQMDRWGKEIEVHGLGPPKNYTSYPNFQRVIGALKAWEQDDVVTAEGTVKTINENYHLAFSLKEKENSVPFITRPDFLAHNESNILAAPPSFQFWNSIRRRLCFQGLDNEDFAVILKNYMKMHKLSCTEEQDLVTTGLWLLGCHEFYADHGFLVFYGRCLLRHCIEGKNLMVNLFFRFPNQLVHFKFADGEESFE